MINFHYKKELKWPKDKREKAENKRFLKLQKKIAKKDKKYLDKVMSDFAKGKDKWL